MKRTITLLLAAAAITAAPHYKAIAEMILGEQLRATNGLVVTGTISGPGVVSTAATAELQGIGDVGLTLARSGPPNTTDENFIAYFAKDANGTSRKTMSISTTWGNPDALNGYSVTRYNTTYAVNGVGVDDLSIRQFGGKGIVLCGNSDADAPPTGTRFMVNCNTWLKGGVQLEQPLGLADGLGQPSCKPGIAQIYVGTDHKPKIMMGSCQVFTLVTQ